MDAWLKLLIAAACVVVIAGGAYYAWGEWQNSSELAASRAAIETASNAITKESGGKPGTQEARIYCESIRSLVRGELKDNPVAKLRANQCRMVGL